jgi:cysteine sulfinate desulfinase/cysteine desulfurase-like protein
MRSICLDYNASTPIAAEVAVAMRDTMDCAFGNPSSPHWAGTPVREIVARARGQVAGLLGCAREEVVFTSGGSESNNFALKGVFFASKRHYSASARLDESFRSPTWQASVGGPECRPSPPKSHWGIARS